MAGETNRRDFLKASALAGAGFWVAGSSRAGAAQGRSPNSKLNFACIGVGGKGSSDTDDAGRDHNIIALCDVDEDTLNKKAEKFPKARKFVDFREMLDKLDKDIDAVTVSTPDHMHAMAAMWAMQRGKHVFVQKPLTHDVWEARTLTEAAKKYKVCTQMGNQGTSSNGLREAVETIWAGTIGPVREVHVWTNRPVWPQGVGALLRIPAMQGVLYGKSAGDVAPPKNLHWDLWLGTAPERKFFPDVYHSFKWRGWWDFGTGALGDMACHTANMAFMACKLGYPTSVEAEMSEYNPETFPMWSVVRYEFPEREGLPPLKWTWYDGGRDKPTWVGRKLSELAHGLKLSDSGSILVGEKGTLFSPNDYGESFYLLFDGEKPIGPLPDAKLHKPPSQILPRADRAHFGEWLSAIEQGKPEVAVSNFGYAGPLTETVVLGCVAMRAQKRIEWDGPNMKITNDEKANTYLKRDYREGWKI